jgi:hypothetical protein
VLTPARPFCTPASYLRYAFFISTARMWHIPIKQTIYLSFDFDFLTRALCISLYLSVQFYLGHQKCRTNCSMLWNMQ